ncbi:hypothetical protein PG994_000796 [Apiospora phragmitis]|uniref:Uncharacterized protein n=1 Tax=Apiospora phragmitis TaxID=2905665 RepID=A0ABR1X7C6_9PEZI
MARRLYKSATSGREVRFTPEEVLAMILSKAKQNAEAYLHSTVKEVQISVPADFGIRKYDAVRDAAAIAGLEVIELLPSPTCASYVLGIERPEEEMYSYVIADVGAGGFSVSVMSSEEGVNEVVSVAGDLGLGGEDFLKTLVRHFAEKVKSMWNKDITKNNRAIRRLRSACEQAICHLSSAQSTEIHLEALCEGRDFFHQLTRQDFESISVGLIKKMRQTLDQAMDDAGVTTSEVKYVFPLGGCSRMLQFRKVLSDYFEYKDLDRFLDTEEAQVCGLAIGSSIKVGDKSNSRTDGSLLLSVLPKSLGVGTLGAGTQVQFVDTILLKNSMMITRKESVFSLSLSTIQGKAAKPASDLSPGTRAVDFYEGEGSLASRNELVGTLDLDSILPLPGPEVIRLKVKLNAKPGFQVKATVTVPGKNRENKKTMSMFLGNRMSEQCLRQSITNEARYRSADEAEAQRVDLRVAVDWKIYDLSELLTMNYEMVRERISDLPETLQKMRIWMEANEDASWDGYHSRLQVLNSIQRDLQEDRGTQARSSQSPVDPAPKYQREPPTASRTSRPRLLKKEINEMVSWLDQIRDEFDARKQVLVDKLAAFPDNDSEASDRGGTDERVPNVGGGGGGRAGTARPYHPPPSMDPAELFESHFDGSKQSYSAADLERISAYLRTTGHEEHSRHPKLYTVLRLIDELRLFNQFVEDGVTDASIPLSYHSLPPSINLEITNKFIGRQTAVPFEV